MISGQSSIHGELKRQLKEMETNYNRKAFRDIINQVKTDRISDDEVLEHIANISMQRFRENISFTFKVPAGNLLWIIITIAVAVLAFQTASDWMLYLSALILMITLHPLFHYITGALLGIRFTHYYLNGPARIEPTLKVDYFSYLKNSPGRRALMHVSGVIGSVMAPLIATLIALNKGASAVALNLFILFLLLVVFELLTSTKIGDLMRARREYGYR